LKNLDKKNALLSSLDNRSRKILQHVIESYIETGTPVASKTISEKIMPSLASATIRNVMANLENLGLLKAPHISAGRIPTESGLQLFVDGLLKIGDITTEEKTNIESLCAATGKSLKDILHETSNALSGLSNCVSLVLAPKFERSIKHIEFVPIDENRALVVIVDSIGLVENRLIQIPRGTTVSSLTEATNFLNKKIGGMTLLEAKENIEEELNLHKDEMNKLSEKIIKAGLAQRTGSMEKPSLILTGKTNIFNDNNKNDFKRINDLFEQIEQGKNLYELLENSLSGAGVHVFIGSDNKLFDYSGCSMILAPLKGREDSKANKGKTLGAIGVIGPTRVNYGRIIPMVDFTAKAISKIFK